MTSAGCRTGTRDNEGSPAFNQTMHHPSPSDILPAARSAFEQYLRSRRIRQTRARTLILETAMDFDEHFEAEQLLYALKEKGHRVGKATIYRTLPLLVQAGILRETRFQTRQTHYERAWGEPAHDHIVCQYCGLIREFDSAEVVQLRDRIATAQDFVVTGHRFQLIGVCARCVKTMRDDVDARRRPARGA